MAYISKLKVTDVSVDFAAKYDDEGDKLASSYVKRASNLFFATTSTRQEDIDRVNNLNSAITYINFTTPPAANHKYIITHFTEQQNFDNYVLYIYDYDVTSNTKTIIVENCVFEANRDENIVDVNGKTIGTIVINSDGFVGIVNDIGQSNDRFPYCTEHAFVEEEKDKIKIAVFGDSITWGAGDNNNFFTKYLQQMMDDANINAEIINCGVGGDSLQDILTRGGFVSAIYNGPDLVVPLDDNDHSVEFDSIVNYILQNKNINPATENGSKMYCKYMLQGDLGRNPSGTANYTSSDYKTVNPVFLSNQLVNIQYDNDSGKFTMSRIKTDNNINTELTIKAGDVLCLHGSTIANKADIVVVCGGTNFGGFIGTSGVDENIQLHKELWQAFKDNIKIPYLVCSPYGGTWINTLSADQVTTYENMMTNLFGNKLLNWRKFMVREALELEGLTATTEDNTAIDAGKCPPQLLADSVHPTAKGHHALATAIFNKLSYLYL